MEPFVAEVRASISSPQEYSDTTDDLVVSPISAVVFERKGEIANDHHDEGGMCGNYEGDNDLILASVHANAGGLDKAIPLHQRCQHPPGSDQCLPTTTASRSSSWPLHTRLDPHTDMAKVSGDQAEALESRISVALSVAAAQGVRLLSGSLQVSV